MISHEAELLPTPVTNHFRTDDDVNDFVMKEEKTLFHTSLM